MNVNTPSLSFNLEIARRIAAPLCVTLAGLLFTAQILSTAPWRCATFLCARVCRLPACVWLSSHRHARNMAPKVETLLCKADHSAHGAAALRDALAAVRGAGRLALVTKDKNVAALKTWLDQARGRWMLPRRLPLAEPGGRENFVWPCCARPWVTDALRYVLSHVSHMCHVSCAGVAGHRW